MKRLARRVGSRWLTPVRSAFDLVMLPVGLIRKYYTRSDGWRLGGTSDEMGLPYSKFHRGVGYPLHRMGLMLFCCFELAGKGGGEMLEERRGLPPRLASTTSHPPGGSFCMDHSG